METYISTYCGARKTKFWSLFLFSWNNSYELWQFIYSANFLFSNVVFSSVPLPLRWQKGQLSSWSVYSHLAYKTPRSISRNMSTAAVSSLASLPMHSLPTNEPVVSVDWVHANLRESDVKVCGISTPCCKHLSPYDWFICALSVCYLGCVWHIFHVIHCKLILLVFILNNFGNGCLCLVRVFLILFLTLCMHEDL